MVAMLIFMFVLLSCALYLYFTRNFSHWERKQVKGPKPIVLFGNMKDGATHKISYNQLFKKYYDEYPKEKVVGLYRMTSPCLLIRDPELIKKIFIKDFDVFSCRGFQIHEKDVGTNLFHSNAKVWNVLRHRYTPVFTTGKLKSYMPILLDSTDKFLDYVRNMVKKNPEIQMHKIVKRYTIAGIVPVAFGIEIAPDDEISHKPLEKIDEAIFDLNIVTEIDMMYPSAIKNLRLPLFPKIVSDFFTDLTTKILNERDGKMSSRGDFMDLLLELKHAGEVETVKKTGVEEGFRLEVTDRMLAAQAFQFFAAAYETTATTIALLFYLLAINEDVKQKVIKDIEATLKKHNNEITYDSIKDMEYLDCAVTESLRMYPLLDPLQRAAERDYHIPELNLTINKGTIVMCSAIGIQNDPQYYPEPEKFKPERFLDSKSKEYMTLTYLPFGIGPRACIGLRLGRIQVKLLVIKLLREFDVVPSPNTPIPLKFRARTLLLCPWDGLHLKLVPRKKTM